MKTAFLPLKRPTRRPPSRGARVQAASEASTGGEAAGCGLDAGEHGGKIENPEHGKPPIAVDPHAARAVTRAAAARFQPHFFCRLLSPDRWAELPRGHPQNE